MPFSFLANYLIEIPKCNQNPIKIIEWWNVERPGIDNIK